MVDRSAKTISIIVPVLNEATCIGLCRDTWMQWTLLEDVECIFVDGGSSDQSIGLLREVGLTVLQSKPGRAQQMNLGASQAQGALLIFLHADTDIDDFESKLQLLRHQFEGCVDQDLFWGFCHVSITGELLTLYQKTMFKCIGTLINIRSKVTGISTGDQLQFISQQLFQRIGGFPKMPLLEDVQFCKNLKGIATPTMMPWGVHTSGRRWLKKGIWFTILYMWKIRFQFWRGNSAHSLASSYKSVR